MSVRLLKYLWLTWLLHFSMHIPALTSQLSAVDLHKVDAVFNKAWRWPLTSHIPDSVDLIKQSGKHFFTIILLFIIIIEFI